MVKGLKIMMASTIGKSHGVQRSEYEIEDQNANGYANVATRIVNDFNEEKNRRLPRAFCVRKNDMF